MGWLVVASVMDGYHAEDAPGPRGWPRTGPAIHVPIGRGPSLAVLSARWLQDRARFGTERGRLQTGEDDIAPAGARDLGEIGFDSPGSLDRDRAINAVWRLIARKIDGSEPPLKVNQENRDRLARRLDVMLGERRRRLRLVVDPADLDNPIQVPTALEAIARAIPWLQLLVIDGGDAAPQGIFLLSPGALAGEIEECLLVIDVL